MRFDPIAYCCLFDISVRNLSKGPGGLGGQPHQSTDNSATFRPLRPLPPLPAHSIAFLYQFVPDNVLISQQGAFILRTREWS